MSQFYSIIFIVALFAVMYFLMIRPQKKHQRKHASLLKKLKPGDRVITIGRVHGIVDKIDRKDQIVSLDCDGVHLTFDLKAVATVVANSDDQVTNKKNRKHSTKDASKKSESKTGTSSKK